MSADRYAKFFVAGFLLIALVAAFRWALLWRVQWTYMDSDFPYWEQQNDYIRAKGDVPEVIFLGDSRTKAAVNPNGLCENAYNLALGGSTAVEMYYSLKRYLKYHPKPEMVIAAFAEYHYSSDEFFKTRNLYLHYTNLFETIEVLLVTYMDVKRPLHSLRSLRKFNDELLDALKYYLLFPQKYSAACINGNFQREESNRATYRETVENKGFWVLGGQYTPPLP